MIGGVRANLCLVLLVEAATTQQNCAIICANNWKGIKLKLDSFKEIGKKVFRVRSKPVIPAKYETKIIDGQVWKRWVSGPSAYFIEEGVVTGWTVIVGTVDDEWPLVAMDFDGVGAENIYDDETKSIFETLEEAEIYKKEKEDEQASKFS